MKKLFIEDVLVGVTPGGMACGPVPGNVVCEVTLRSEDGIASYYSLVEVAGTLNFLESETSIYQSLIDDELDDEEYSELMETCYAAGYDSYDDFYEKINAQQPLSTEALVYKYLAYMVWASWNEVDLFRELTLGKYIGEFEIPVSDPEADLNEELDY